VDVYDERNRKATAGLLTTACFALIAFTRAWTYTFGARRESIPAERNHILQISESSESCWNLILSL